MGAFIRIHLWSTYAVGLILACAVLTAVTAQERDAKDEVAQRLIPAIMGPSPMEENLHKLTDEIGGRVPGAER